MWWSVRIESRTQRSGESRGVPHVIAPGDERHLARSVDAVDAAVRDDGATPSRPSAPISGSRSLSTFSSRQDSRTRGISLSWEKARALSRTMRSSSVRSPSRPSGSSQLKSASFSTWAGLGEAAQAPRSTWKLSGASFDSTANTPTPVTEIKKMTIWGNHSATQYPDLFHCEVSGENAAQKVGDQAWLENDFIPTVAKRGAAIIEARGASSAASAASATVDHARDWALGTPEGDWVSMSVVSDGSYGVPEGLVSSFPVTISDGRWSIVQGLDIDEFSRAKIDASVKELEGERDAVKGLGLI